jgi:cellulose synthase/poly-beta-1,6-N-acetylglucosamine synthase-like glycosyltransferase
MPTFAIILCIFLLLALLVYFGVILLFTAGWYRLGRSGRTRPADPGYPRVSVIVAARNEEDAVMTLLEDLEQQDYRDMQVILVDDGSTDGTLRRVQEFLATKGAGNMSIYPNNAHDGQGSKKAAIDHGISLADGQVILLTDADCRVAPGWAAAMAKHFADPEVKMVAGPVMYIDLKSITDRFEALEFLGLVASGAGAAGAGVPFMCNGANLAYRRKTFHEVAGFSGNEHYRSGDDVFLMHKVKQRYGSSSIRFATNREAIVGTRPAGSFRAFLRQRARWASKTTGYRDLMAIFTAVSVFLLNVSLLAALLGGFFHPPLFLVFLASILLKTWIDLPLLLGITGFTRQKSLLKWILLFQAAYPLYITSAGLWSFFRKKNW